MNDHEHAQEHTRDNRNRRGRADRVLLGAVLAMQIAILAFLLFGRRVAPTPLAPTSVDVSAPPSSAPHPHSAYPPAPAVAAHMGSFDPFAGHERPETDRLAAAVFRDLIRFRGHMEWLMEKSFTDWPRLGNVLAFDDGWEMLVSHPAMDMREDDARYVVLVSLPGLQRSDVAVLLDDRLLTLLARLRRTAAERSAIYEQRVRMPGPVGDGETAEAGLTNGILRVVVPKGRGAETVGRRFRLL